MDSLTDAHADALGSIIALTDTNGTLRTQYNYSPFGVTQVIGEASENPFQFAGRENDGTGLYYYRARYYSPEMGRFISEDPIGLAGGINFFSYVGNNPLNFVDPLGLWEVVWRAALMGADFSTTIYDSNLRWVPDNKPNVRVSTTFAGAGFSIGFDGLEPDPKLKDSELEVGVGLGEYLGISTKPDFSKWNINLGAAIATPISFSTSVKNFAISVGDMLKGIIGWLGGKETTCE